MADSHPIYRAGVSQILTQESDIRVVSEADSLSSLHSAFDSVLGDIVLLEGQLASMAPNAIPDLVRRHPGTKVIIETTASEQMDIVEFFLHGARGVVDRTITAAQLVKSVRKVAAGETWIDNDTVNLLIKRYQQQTATLNSPPIEPHLSDIEHAITARINHGMRNKEIAFQLGTTEQVIKNWLSKIYRKMNVSGRLDLALYCQRHRYHMDHFMSSIDIHQLSQETEADFQK